MTKKRTIILILFVFFAALYNATASDIYDLRDLTAESPQFVGLYPKDFVRFQYFNATHLVQIEKILNDKEVNIKIFPYKQNGTYLTIGDGRVAQLDLDRDLNDDISISVFKIDQNVTVLQFTSLEKKDDIIIPSEFGLDNMTKDNNNQPKAQDDKSDPIIGISLIVIAIVLGVVITKLIKKDKK